MCFNIWIIWVVLHGRLRIPIIFKLVLYFKSLLVQYLFVPRNHIFLEIRLRRLGKCLFTPNHLLFNPYYFIILWLIRIGCRGGPAVVLIYPWALSHILWLILLGYKEIMFKIWYFKKCVCLTLRDMFTVKSLVGGSGSI